MASRDRIKLKKKKKKIKGYSTVLQQKCLFGLAWNKLESLFEQEMDPVIFILANDPLPKSPAVSKPLNLKGPHNYIALL